MPNGLLPEHQVSAPNVDENNVVETTAEKPEAEVKDVASIAAELQTKADAEAAANQALIENPSLTEEEAEAVGKAKASKKVAKDKEADPSAAAKSVTDKPAAEAGEYTPNFKYKVLDQDKEIPEWIRGSVNKENESQIRELFEKADGLDHVKTKLNEERQEHQGFKENYTQVQNELRSLVTWRDKNLGVFFEKAGVSKQAAAKWLLQELEKQEMPEDVRRVYNEHEEQQRKLVELETENLRLSSTRELDGAKALAHELGQVLSEPSIATLVAEFDKRVGKPNSFSDMVARHGHAEWEASGGKVVLSPKEAVDQVLKILNLSTTQAPDPVAKPNESAAKTPEVKRKVVQQAKPVVLPTVTGGGNAPTSTKMKSVADIRKAYKQMSGQN